MRYTKQWLLSAIAMVAVTWSVGACALVDETIDIKPQQPQSSKANTPDNAGLAVEVKGADARPQHRDRVATKKNGYGVELAKIKSTKGVIELVRSSVEQELKSKGYTIAPGGVVVTAEVLSFYSDFKPNFLVPVADSAAEVSFNLKVTAAGGGYVYGHTYSATGKSTDVLVMTPGGAREALEQAFADALRQLDQDRALFSALASSPTQPAVAHPQPTTLPTSAAMGNSPLPATSAPSSTTAPPPIDPASGLSRSRL